MADKLNFGEFESPWKILHISLILAIISIIGALIIGFSVYRYSLESAKHRYQQFYLNTASLIVESAENRAEKFNIDLSQTLETVWGSLPGKPADEYICIVDSKSSLILHTANPKTAGNYCGLNQIFPEQSGEPSKLEDLVDRQQNYVGEYISSAGENQIAAFVAIPEKNWIFGLHRSREAFVGEIENEIGYLKYGFLLICVVLMPLSFALLYWTFHSAQAKRKKAEDSLLKSNTLLTAVIDNTTDSIFLKDFEGRYVLANEATLQAIGKSQEEVIGRDDSELFPPESFQVINETDSAVIKTGKTRLTEEKLTTSFGETYWLTSKNPYRDKDGNIIGLIGISRNITNIKKAEKEKKQLEGRLNQAQKMEAIGTLAGGIAHDFNNILASILGYADMAKEDTPAGSTVAKDLDKVLKAGYRAKDLVKQILAFSRQGKAERIPFQPASVIKEALKMLRSSIPTTIEIHEDIDPICGVILADPTQFHQILMNLCTNAFHAMEETGGKLSISLKDMELRSDDFPDEQGIASGNYVELTVRDSGPGIDPNLVDKIFEPYFTTKETGKGTGMGLAIVHGIIKSYGGTITVENNPGVGAAFHVFLPVTESEAVPEIDSTEPIQEGQERILFVDDEELLADMGKDMLERLGYKVTTRESSLDALETFQNQPDQFDLVITDQTMPGMTGADLARRMLQIRPDIPIILCTGYSTIMSEEKAKSFGIKEFALKPIVKKDIAKLIRKVFDTL